MIIFVAGCLYWDYLYNIIAISFISIKVFGQISRLQTLWSVYKQPCFRRAHSTSPSPLSAKSPSFDDKIGEFSDISHSSRRAAREEVVAKVSSATPSSLTFHDPTSHTRIRGEECDRCSWQNLYRMYPGAWLSRLLPDRHSGRLWQEAGFHFLSAPCRRVRGVQFC